MNRAFSQRFSILNDLPLFWDQALLERGIHAARLHEGVPSRFAVIPRHGTTADIRWFEAAPCYVLHWLNAYEDGDEVVLDGYFQEVPTPGPKKDAPPGYEYGRWTALDQKQTYPTAKQFRRAAVGYDVVDFL